MDLSQALHVCWVFPVAIVIATVALSTGISGALFFSPFFLLVGIIARCCDRWRTHGNGYALPENQGKLRLNSQFERAKPREFWAK